MCYAALLLINNICTECTSQIKATVTSDRPAEIRLTVLMVRLGIFNQQFIIHGRAIEFAQ